MDPSDASYIPDEPVLGTFLINLGDLATVWSNGKLRQGVEQRDGAAGGGSLVDDGGGGEERFAPQGGIAAGTGAAGV
ncbi:unnamed protein product [Linum trigynum]|uniref:Uncharacterized protein n=1 Tax=Linum trigynum TaxID=586398 RepID=A0AAV2CSI6_9ROSI